MVYKKYVYKRGKKHGPYYYHSYREGNDIKKVYIGDEKEYKKWMEKNSENKTISKKKLIILPLILVLLIIAGFSLYNYQITGKASLRLQGHYLAGEILSGELQVKLKSGELIPQDAKIYVEQQGFFKEFNFSDFVEMNADGNYYVEGKDIDGEGFGYGFIGEKVSYPDVYFTLVLGTEEEQETEEKTKEDEEEENETAEEVAEEEIETPIETLGEEQETEIPEETPAEENSDSEQETETPEESSQEETPTETPITGGVVDGESEIHGKVNAKEEFTYDIESEEKVSIKAGSVYSDTENLSSSDIDLEIKNKRIKVTTDYSVSEEGFGGEFLTNENKELSISLDKLNIPAIDGKLIVRLIYEDAVIAEIEKEVKVEGGVINITGNETEAIENLTETENATEIIQTEKTNLTMQTRKYNVVLNKPVKWHKKLNVEGNLSDVSVNIPKNAGNISIKTGEDIILAVEDAEEEESIIAEDKKSLVTGQVSLEISRKRGLLTRIWDYLGRTLSGNVVDENVEVAGVNAEDIEDVEDISGGIVIETAENKVVMLDENELQEAVAEIEENNNADVLLEYETPGPSANETEIANGKRVEIYADDEYNYTDVLAYTELNNEVAVGSGRIKIYWTTTREEAMKYGYLGGNVSNVEEESIETITIETPAEENISAGEENVTGEKINATSQETETEAETQNQGSETPTENGENETETGITGSAVKDLDTGENIFQKLIRFITGKRVTGNVVSAVEENYDIKNEKSAMINRGFNGIDIQISLATLQNIYAEGLFKSLPIVTAVEENSTEIQAGEVDTETETETGTEISLTETEAENETEIVRVEVEFFEYDLDGDGKVDYIEWIVPHLSAQSYDIIISGGDVNGVAVDNNKVHLVPNTASAPYDSLVLYYSFDVDNTDATGFTAYDFSSSARDWVGASGAVVNNSDCIFGNCLQLDGTANAYVGTAGVFSLTSWTASFWIRSRENHREMVIGDSGSCDLLGVYYDINDLWFRNTACTYSPALDDGLVIDPNIWYHIVFTGNTTDIAAYVNNVFIESATMDTSFEINQIGFSYSSTSPTYAGNGSMDEVMIFNISLTPAQISAIYNNQSARFGSSGSIGYNLSITPGYDTINITSNFTNSPGTNISLKLGYFTGGSWSVTAEQNITGRDEFTIDSTVVNITTNYTLQSDSYQFYTPLLNVSVNLLTADLIAPTITILNPVNNSNFNKTSVEFNVSMDENSSWCGLSINSAANVSMNLNSSGTGGNYTNITIGDGSYSFVVNCNDTDNNLQVSDVYYFVVDAIFPAISFVTPVNATNQNSNSAFVNLTATDTNQISVLTSEGLVSWWRMDEGSWVINEAGGVVDYMGRNNGAAKGNVAQSDSGYFGKGGSFDGSGDYVLGGSSPFDFADTTFTVSVWIKSGFASGLGYIIAEDAKTSGGWALSLNSGKIIVVLKNGGSNAYVFSTTDATFADDAWHHVVANITTNTASAASLSSVYVDGSLEAGSANNYLAYSTSTNAFTIGSRLAGDSSVFNGTIDDVMIFNRTLTTAEISALYNASANKYTNNFTGLGEGSKTFTGYVQDIAGNIASATSTITIDTTYPDVNFTNPTPSDSSTQSGNSIYVNVTSSDTNQHYTLSNFDNSLVAWWRMDDVNSTGDVVDYLGVNNGTKVGNAIQTDAGKFGKGFAFDGSGDYVDVGNLADAKTTNITISFWANPATTISATTPVFSSSSGHYYVGFRSTNGVGVSYQNNTGSLKFISAATSYATPGEWHMFTYTINVSGTGDTASVSVNIYRDTSAVKSDTTSQGWYSSYGTAWVIGAYSSGSSFFNGTIDDVLIFNRTLSTAEISALYNASASQYYNNFTGLADGVHTFTGYAVDLGGNLNSTETRSVTVLSDAVAPNVTVIYPVNGSYYSLSNMTFNLTVSDDTGVSGCLYSLDSGVTNYTMSNTTATAYNATNSSIADGTYTANFYCNDTTNNLNNSESVTFTLDTGIPILTITNPTAQNYTTSSNIDFNVTSSEAGTGSLVSNLDGSLISWWRMDDINSTGDVVDYLGLNNGTKVGNAAQTDSGKFGKGFEFDGSGDYVSVADSTDLGLLNDFSISLWIYDKSSTDDRQLEKGDSYFLVDNIGSDSCSVGRFGFAVKQSNSLKCVDVNADHNLNQWYHIVMQKNASDILIYQNGIFKKSRALSGNIDDDNLPLIIGADDSGTYFNGTIDDVMIFNRTLTTDEIIALYNASAISHASALADGTHSYSAYTQDLAGNLDSESVSFGVEAGTDVTMCRTLSTANTTYTLQNNLSTTGTCLVIGANNITIDLNGKTIDGDGNSQTDFGVNVGVYNSTSVKNGKITDFGTGISVNNGNNGNFTNLTITTNGNFGLFANIYGISISGDSSNNYIANNNISNIYAIVAGALDVKAITINSATGTNNVIENNILSNNWGTGNVGTGISILSENSIIQNNTLNSNSETGIYVGSNNTILANNTLNSNAQYGVYITGSNNNISNTQSTSDGYGVYITTGDNNYVKDSNFSLASNYDVYLVDASINNILTNVSFSSVSTGASTSTFYRKWYYQVYVNDTNGNPVSGANITAYNSSGEIEFSVMSNESGWIEKQEITDYYFLYHPQGNYKYYSPYTINATNSSYPVGSVSYNVTLNENNLNHNIEMDNNYPLISYGTGTETDASTITWNNIYVNVSVTEDNEDTIVFNLYYSNGTSVNSSSYTDGTRNINWTNVPDGTYKFNVTVNDTIGQANSTATYTVTLDLVNITKCRSLNQTNTVYTLQNDLSATGTCLTIGANNITIDLNGKTIDGDGNYQGDYGILNSGAYTNLSVKNGKITDFGIGISSSGASGNYSNVTITGSVVDSGLFCLQYGISLSGANNIIENSNMSNLAVSGCFMANDAYGISLGTGNGNNITNTLANSNTYGLQISVGDNNYVKDSNFSLSSTNDVAFSGTSTNNILTNVSFSSSSVASGSQLIRKWYYRSLVNDTSGNFVVANVTAYNVTGTYNFNLTTDATGYTSTYEIIDYVNVGGTKSYYSNYTINATNSSYTAYVTYNVTLNENNLAHNIQLSEIGVSSCSELADENTVYTMVADITDNDLTGNCIVISAENITFDCAGYSITSDDVYAGIYSNQLNTTVRNCTVSMGIADGGTAVKLEGANNSYIFNNTFNEQNIGIHVLTADNVRIENNSVYNATTATYGGIYLEDAEDTYIAGGNVTYSSAYGIYIDSNCVDTTLDDVHGAEAELADVYNAGTGTKIGCIFDSENAVETETGIELIDNVVLGDGMYGFKITHPDIVFDCKGYSITRVGAVAYYNNTGIYNNQSNFTVQNCNISMGTSLNGRAMYFQNTNNSKIINNTLSNNYEALSMRNVNNSVIVNNTLKSNARAVMFSVSSNNNLTNNYLWNCTDATYGCMLLSGSDENRISGGAINLSASYLVYIRDSRGDTAVGNIFENVLMYNSTSGGVLITSPADGTGNVYFSTGNVFENVTIYSPNSATKGIYTDASNTTIRNSNITMSTSGPGGDAIYLNASNSSVIENNFLNRNEYGVYGEKVHFTSVDNNTMNSNLFYGVYFTSNSVFSPNTYNNITNNIINSNTQGGIYLYMYNNYNYVANNTLNSNPVGISTALSNYNIFENNDIWNCTSELIGCLEIATSDSNNITGGIINLTASNSIYISGSDNNIFKDINLSIDANHGLYFSFSTGNVFLNSSYDLDEESVGSGSSLTKKSYYTANITEYYTGRAISGAVISIVNSTGNSQFEITSGADGLTTSSEIVDYVNTGGTRGYYSPYTISVANSSYLARNYVWNVSANENVIDNNYLFYSQSNVTLHSGWNLISLEFNTTDTETDREVAVVSGWNLIGHSSNVSVLLSSCNFTETSTGTEYTWSDAVAGNKVKNYLAYYDYNSTNASERKFKYVADSGMDDTYLRDGYGYWLYSNGTAGTFTIPGIGGSSSSESYLWNKLRFSNGTDEKNITDADAENWIFMAGDSYVYYYDNVEQDYDIICSDPLTCSIPDGKTTLSPWEGYFVWSNRDNITLIRQN